MATEVMATQALGNTKSRAWQFTINNVSHYEEIKSKICEYKSLRFFISCQEVAPTTGHEHIHIYAYFNNPIKVSYDKFHGAHIEKCLGSPKQNIAYIKKDGKILDEFGDIPHQGGLGVKNLKDIEDPDDLPDWHMYNTWKKIKSESEFDIKIDDYHKDVEVHYIFGPSGIGKTELAKQLMKNAGFTTMNRVKYSGNFWEGVGTAECCLYDDFRDSHMPASEFINFIDYNRQLMNIKGGVKSNNYKFIVITSIQNPEDIYSRMGDEPRQQWLRRIKIHDLTPTDDNTDYLI